MGDNEDIRSRSEAIRQKAFELGFTDCGFARAEHLPEDARRLEQWLNENRHASMGYMANHFEKRTNPSLLVPGALSVISLLFNYYNPDTNTDPEAPVVSRYAYGKDYHFVLKGRMSLLMDFIRELEPAVEGRMFVDSAPVLDRAWARRAGLGWIGKNSHLISRKHGSWVFIGELILNLELDYATIPESDFCGSCTKCIEACPSDAILDIRSIDAGRCLSYQTIENRKEIDPKLKEQMDNRLFGCDICQEVCPWNRKVLRHEESEFEVTEGLLEMGKGDWEAMEGGHFKKLFKNSPLQRAGLKKIKNTLDFL